MQMQMVLWGSLAAVAMFFLITFLVLLCSTCDREKKPRQHSGDHENLMNVVSLGVAVCLSEYTSPGMALLAFDTTEAGMGT